MKQFEYFRMFVPRYAYDALTAAPDAEALRQKGEEGWELCAVSTGDSAGVRIFYFKRELGQEYRT